MKETEALFTPDERAAWQPPENLTPSQWAEKYRRLPRGQSNLSDRYRNALSPYSRTVMDLCAVPGLATLCVIKAAQVGISEALRNVIGWSAHLVPDPCGIAMPDEKKGRAIVDNRILPLFRGTPVLRKLMTSRSSDATKQQVKLQNGFILHLMWSGSASSMASDPMRIGICDEVDKFSPWTHGQGEPVALVKARLRTYGNRGLLICASTPGTRYGRIWQLFDECSIKAKFHVPCPSCSAMQPLVFSQLKFDKGPAPDRRAQADYIRRHSAAWYECPHCNARIIETQRPEIVRAGRYQVDPAEGEIKDAGGNIHQSLETVRAFSPGTSVGLHINGLSCLWLTWAEIAAEFVRAQGSREKIFSFKTDTLGEPFDEQIIRVHADAFSAKSQRAKLDEGFIPKWAPVLTATVDTQHTHFKCVLRGWGTSEDGGAMESARVWHGRLESFVDIENNFLNRAWRYEGDVYPPIKPQLILIDSGGTKLESDEMSRTMEVYRWAWKWRLRGVRAIKGVSGSKGAQYIWPSKAIQTSGHGSAARRRRTELIIYMLDVHHFSDELADLVTRGRANPAEEIWHLNKRDDPEYNQELSNCVKTIERVGNQLQERWRPVSDGARIDFFDCETYQIAAAYMANVHTLPARREMEKQRAAIQSTVPVTERQNPWQLTRLKL